MSDIMVAIDGIAGESKLIGYNGQIECLAMRHVIDLPVVARGATRVEGASRHGPIEFDHPFDIASPGLRLALSAGSNLGEVVITRMRLIGGSSQAAEIITLGNTYVVRMDVETFVNAETGRSEEDAIESFALEYSDIRWDYKKYVNGVETGSVQGAWSSATQSNAI